MLGGVFGVTLMLWICIQFYMFPANFMDISFFLFGLAQAATGYAAWVFSRQEEFASYLRRYDRVGTNEKRLVVYFSRLGAVRQAALEEADRTGAEVYEIKPTERVSGTLGFWWCGRFGMHRWDMPIAPITVDLEKYSRVCICSPIWVFALASPVRCFCRMASGKIGSVDYILVHHTGGAYMNAAAEMDALLGVKHTGLQSVQCRTGKYKTIVQG